MKEQEAHNRIEQARNQYLAEHNAGQNSILTQRQALLGFVLYSTYPDVAMHLVDLADQGKLNIKKNWFLKGEQGELAITRKAAITDKELLDNVSYSFNVPNKANITTPIKFEWDDNRLKVISGNINADANNWINPQIVKMFEKKLGPSKSFYSLDTTKCYYWIKGGREVLLNFPLKGNPKFSYTALAPPQEFIDEEKKRIRKNTVRDSLAAVKTSNDL
ncbi:MAG: hypothetical protein EOO61_11115 [Hymenobacter sp.]|nr:MAG: hypothetical protein EOO61_11115 [Hymenobacter sp.]